MFKRKRKFSLEVTKLEGIEDLATRAIHFRPCIISRHDLQGYPGKFGKFVYFIRTEFINDNGLVHAKYFYTISERDLGRNLFYDLGRDELTEEFLSDKPMVGIERVLKTNAPDFEEFMKEILEDL